MTDEKMKFIRYSAILKLFLCFLYFCQPTCPFLVQSCLDHTSYKINNNNNNNNNNTCNLFN